MDFPRAGEHGIECIRREGVWRRKVSLRGWTERPASHPEVTRRVDREASILPGRCGLSTVAEYAVLNREREQHC